MNKEISNTNKYFQKKYILDARNKSSEELELVSNLLENCNNKSEGEEVTFSDIVLYALKKLNKNDIAKIKEASLGKWDLLKKELSKYNQKNNVNLKLEEFLVQKLKLQ